MSSSRGLGVQQGAILALKDQFVRTISIHVADHRCRTDGLSRVPREGRRHTRAHRSPSANGTGVRIRGNDVQPIISIDISQREKARPCAQRDGFTPPGQSDPFGISHHKLIKPVSIQISNDKAALALTGHRHRAGTIRIPDAQVSDLHAEIRGGDLHHGLTERALRPGLYPAIL